MDVEFWETESGRSPVKEFIDKLKDRSLIINIKDLIEILEIHGNRAITFAPKGIKKLSGYNMYELRIKNKRVLVRIFFVIVGVTAWLLHIFQKQSKGTPAKELATALNRAKQIPGYINK